MLQINGHCVTCGVKLDYLGRYGLRRYCERGCPERMHRRQNIRIFVRQMEAVSADMRRAFGTIDTAMKPLNESILKLGAAIRESQAKTR